jgi:mannobiose 2-epimerase
MPLVVVTLTGGGCSGAPAVDVAWYRQDLIKTADLWNGGLDGQSGMGAYAPGFDGLFHVILDRRWNPYPTQTSTTVAQSRAIYMNVEAYRVAGPKEGERFLKAVIDGVDALMNRFHDPAYGGFYWRVDDSSVMDDTKHGYGNFHALFALTQAYSATGNPKHLELALEQYEVIKEHLLDPEHPGGVRSAVSRDFSTVLAGNSVDPFTHWFEDLLTLYDNTEGPQREAIADMIVLHGNFITQRLYHDQEGYTDRGYVAYNYDESWEPSQVPYTRERQWVDAQHASTGHNIELAFLLSRAVERGFDAEWLDVATKLLEFCLAYAMHPELGGMILEVTDYEGKPLDGNPDNALFLWWAQAETARVTLHNIVVRDRKDLVPLFLRTQTLLREHLTDPEYGGWYDSVNANSMEPVGLDKGHVWKTNYHYSMLYAEVLRLGALYPGEIEALDDFD